MRGVGQLRGSADFGSRGSLQAARGLGGPPGIGVSLPSRRVGPRGGGGAERRRRPGRVFRGRSRRATLKVGEREYRPGDRVVVLRTGPAGPRRGAFGTILDVDTAKRAASVSWDDETTRRRMDRGAMGDVGYGYAVHAAVGSAERWACARPRSPALVGGIAGSGHDVGVGRRSGRAKAGSAEDDGASANPGVRSPPSPL